MNDVYLDFQSITTHYLGIIGFVLNGFVWPCHCRISWQDSHGKWWMTELADTPDFPEFHIAGKGDGYRIYIYEVSAPAGTKVGQADPAKVFEAARRYASTEKGDLWYSGPLRKWYHEPQGYGGPMYDECTSNTFAHWVLKQCGLTFVKPKGAFGWEATPLFPGPF